MSNDIRRMVDNRQKFNLLPSINFKHIISLVILLLVTTSSSTQQQLQPSSVYECPDSCVCNEIDFSARCENIQYLIESYDAKHHRDRYNNNLMPINSLDLSNNQLTEIPSKIEILVNLTDLNLSHNQLTRVETLHFAHLEKLDLSYNHITSAELSKLPRNIIHLNLTHNKIKYLPHYLMKLKKLRTLELNENPINCRCKTLMVRDWIEYQSIWSSNAILCHAPQIFKGQPWLQARKNEVCIKQPSSTTPSSNNDKWENFDMNDVMQGDQPMDDDVPLNDEEDYDNDKDGKEDDTDVNYDEGDDKNIFDDDDDNSKKTTENDESDNNIPDDNDQHNKDELKEEFIPVQDKAIEDHHHHHGHESSTVEPATSVEKIKSSHEDENENDEGSGIEPILLTKEEEEENDGSGSGGGLLIIPSIVHHESSSEQPPPVEEEHSEEIIEHSSPNLDLNIFEEATEVPTEVPILQKGAAENVPGAISKTDDKTNEELNTATTEDNTGTYILLVIIGILLVSLIIFVAMKNRQEKRQNRRRYDVEKNATELQDMDKSLLGKPLEKNGNGKHAEHSPLINEFPEPKEYRPYNAPAITVDEPVQELPQKSQQSLYDNNMPNGNGHAAVEPIHGNGSVPKSPDSEDEVFHPAVEDHNEPESLKVEPEVPKRYSPIYSPTSPNSNRRYSPVYDEQGRVKIKLTETPKPKTPIIVNRTRSRAGEYINTPN
ncbi:hypothetical protein PVAND_009075 [Polypedilum vanderplanki]|uniref:Leucine-rich repeat protein n=1 Tax=Polypedilum vanderplanki TaxID=319348 RepID=A0A9J6CCC8_POLVA|nr:hypothetical protein PVAND_009075 [Polypedilum vanderplanki]